MVIPALEILSKKQGHQQKNTIRSDVHSFDEYLLIFAKCQALLWAPGGSAVSKTDKISVFLELTIEELDNICTYVSWS